MYCIKWVSDISYEIFDLKRPHQLTLKVLPGDARHLVFFKWTKRASIQHQILGKMQYVNSQLIVIR